MNKEMWNEGYEKGYADAMGAKRNQPTVIVDCGASYIPEEKIEFSLKVTKENEDGSADAMVKFNRAAMECILQWGIIKMIEEGLKTYAPRGEKDAAD